MKVSFTDVYHSSQSLMFFVPISLCSILITRHQPRCFYFYDLHKVHYHKHPLMLLPCMQLVTCNKHCGALANTVALRLTPCTLNCNKGGLSLLVPHRRYLAVFGGIWRYLAVFGGIWRYLAVFGGIWRYLAVFGGIWRYLAVFGGIWRYLAVFGICVFYASCQPSGCIRSSVYISIRACPHYASRRGPHGVGHQA